MVHPVTFISQTSILLPVLHRFIQENRININCLAGLHRLLNVGPKNDVGFDNREFCHRLETLVGLRQVVFRK